jgi:hypothetical protein
MILCPTCKKGELYLNQNPKFPDYDVICTKCDVRFCIDYVDFIDMSLIRDECK